MLILIDQRAFDCYYNDLIIKIKRFCTLRGCGWYLRKDGCVNVIGQTATEKDETISIPTSTESKSDLSETTIEIDRNVFIDLINDRIGNNTEAIRDTIEDTIMYVYKEEG